MCDCAKKSKDMLDEGVTDLVKPNVMVSSGNVYSILASINNVLDNNEKQIFKEGIPFNFSYNDVIKYCCTFVNLYVPIKDSSGIIHYVKTEDSDLISKV